MVGKALWRFLKHWCNESMVTSPLGGIWDSGSDPNLKSFLFIRLGGACDVGVDEGRGGGGGGEGWSVSRSIWSRFSNPDFPIQFPVYVIASVETEILAVISLYVYIFSMCYLKQTWMYMCCLIASLVCLHMLSGVLTNEFHLYDLISQEAVFVAMFFIWGLMLLLCFFIYGSMLLFLCMWCNVVAMFLYMWLNVVAMCIYMWRNVVAMFLYMWRDVVAMFLYMWLNVYPLFFQCCLDLKWPLTLQPMFWSHRMPSMGLCVQSKCIPVWAIIVSRADGKNSKYAVYQIYLDVTCKIVSRVYRENWFWICCFLNCKE